MLKKPKWAPTLPLMALISAAGLFPGCATLEFLSTLGDAETQEDGSLSPDFKRDDTWESPGRPWTRLENPSSERAPAPRISESESQNPFQNEGEPDDRPGIELGMNRSEVRRLWGTPAEVEFAGHPSEGNFRWIYPLSTHRDLADSRIVTFESGRVAGWETVRPD